MLCLLTVYCYNRKKFSQLFGEHNEDEDVAPDREDPEAAGEAAGTAALEKESKSDVNFHSFHIVC